MKFTTLLAAPVILSSALITVSAAQAADVSHGLYLGVGVSYAKAQKVKFSDESTLKSIDKKHSTGMHAFIGYKVNKWFSGEFAYNDFGKLRFNEGEGDTAAKVDRRTRAYTLSAIGEVPIWAGLIGYGRLGVAYVDSQLKETDLGGKIDKKWAPVYGLGVQYQWTQIPVFTRLEYTRYDIRSHFKIDTIQLSVGSQF